MNRLMYAIVALIILALAVLLVLGYNLSKNSGSYSSKISGINNGSYTQGANYSGYQKLYVAISDPSTLPRGTSGIYLTFSNMSVYVNSIGWISTGGYGPINLVALGNNSELIGDVIVPKGLSIQKVKLGVMSAYAQINNSRYTISVPSKYLYANQSQSNNSANYPYLNVAITPFLSPNYSNTINTSINMYYFASANVKPGNPNQAIGDMLPNHSNNFTTNASIFIGNASIIANGGGTTQIRLSITNNAPYPISIYNIEILGPENISINSSKAEEESSIYTQKILQSYIPKVNSSASYNTEGSLVISELFNSTAMANGEINATYYNYAIKNVGNLASIIVSNLTGLYEYLGPIPKDFLNSTVGRSENSSLVNIKNKIYSNVFSSIKSYDSSLRSSQSNISTIFLGINNTKVIEQNPKFAGSQNGLLIKPNTTMLIEFNKTFEIGQIDSVEISLVPDSSYTIIALGSNSTYATYALNAT